VKAFIIPDIVLFVNGIPLVVVECKKGSETCANPMQEAFVQLQRYMRRRKETEASGLKEGEPRLFHTNLLLVRSCGLEADYGTITSGEEHFYAWKTLHPADDEALAGLNAQQQLIAGDAEPGQPAADPSHLLGVHGHRRWPAGQGGVPLPAVPRGRARS
jgi:type I restriction enzyme R subunit